MDRISGLEKSGWVRTAKFRSFSLRLRKAESQSSVQSVCWSFLKTPRFGFNFPNFSSPFLTGSKSEERLCYGGAVGNKVLV